MKEIMNPKWEDADDCEDKIRQFTDKTEITNQKWKKERKMTNLHNYYKHNCSSFLGSSSRFMLYTKIVHNVGYWLLRNFLNQSAADSPPAVFCILFMIFFVCCLWELPQWCSIACFKKQDYLWFLGKPNYSIFEFENLFFLSLLSPTVLQSNRIHYYFLWISSHQELSFLLTLMRKKTKPFRNIGRSGMAIFLSTHPMTPPPSS